MAGTIYIQKRDREINLTSRFGRRCPVSGDRQSNARRPDETRNHVAALDSAAICLALLKLTEELETEK